MGWPTHILEVLMYYNGGYRIIRERMRNQRPVSVSTLKATLSRMKRAGLVSNKSKRWRITPRGQACFLAIRQKQKQTLPAHTARQPSLKQKTMIVIFDIPETQKRARAWLRIELSNLGFMMLQKSVWFGPAPLPKKFIESLEQMKLLRYIKFFKATSADII